MKITFTLNGTSTTVIADPMERLLDILRAQPDVHGVKEGCGEGECGACAVFLNGRLVNSCITPAANADGAEVYTIEGLRDTERFRTIESAFEKTGGVQCGFCTPGFVMAADALLRRTPRPTDAQIREGLSGNICRCTGYTMIIDAVHAASEALNDR